jgi:hypothetical protein
MTMLLANGADLQNAKLTSVGTPTSGTDGVNKAYVDGLIAGVSSTWLAPVRAKSVGANVSLSAPGASLDGVTLAVNDRLLLADQTDATQNGIWVWTGAAVALTRAADTLKSGNTVVVAEGTTPNDNTAWVLATNGTITPGTTSQSWLQLPGSAGVTRSSLGATGKYAQTIGDGSATSIAVTHGLNTTDLTVSCRRVSDGAVILPDWTPTSTTVATFTFATPPAANAVRVVMVG